MEVNDVLPWLHQIEEYPEYVTQMAELYLIVLVNKELWKYPEFI